MSVYNKLFEGLSSCTININNFSESMFKNCVMVESFEGWIGKLTKIHLDKLTDRTMMAIAESNIRKSIAEISWKYYYEVENEPLIFGGNISPDNYDRFLVKRDYLMKHIKENICIVCVNDCKLESSCPFFEPDKWYTELCEGKESTPIFEYDF